MGARLAINRPFISQLSLINWPISRLHLLLNNLYKLLHLNNSSNRILRLSLQQKPTSSQLQGNIRLLLFK
jgi:hypothetical protein